MTDEQRTTATILDEYCRYYSDFSKMLSIYVKNAHPQIHFDYPQLLDASYNVWHRLNNEEKISLAMFFEEVSREHDQSSSLKMKTFNGIINCELPLKGKSSGALNTNSSLTPYNIYLKDERRKLIRKHAKMPMREVNKRLSERWHRMSKRMKGKYEHRSYLAKKRLYKTQGKIIQLKKPSFIKRKTM